MDTDFIKHLPEDFTQDFRFSFEGVDDPAQYLKEKLGVSLEDVSGTVTLGRDQILGMHHFPSALLPSDLGEAVIDVRVSTKLEKAKEIEVVLISVNGQERYVKFPMADESFEGPTDLDCLSGMPSLIHLDMWYYQPVKDISGLSELLELRHLDLCQAPQVRDLGPISNLTKLEELDLDHAFTGEGTHDLSFLKGAKNLRWLVLIGAGHWLRDLRGLEALPHLEELYLGNTVFPKEVDLTPIQGLQRLRRLQLGAAEFESLDFLKGLEHLEWLEFDLPTSRLTDLSALSELGSLQEVHFDFDLEANPRDIDVSPLAQCPALRLVGLSQDPIEAIAGVDVLRERGDIEIVTSTED